MIKALPLFFALTASAIHAQTFYYAFDADAEGWTGGFADYPVDADADFYALEYGHAELPSPIGPSDHGLRIQGDNHSDDLFMFVKRRITGLEPNTAYAIMFELEVASSASTNAVGVGGAPGEGVVFHAGATLIEPLAVVDGTDYHMNIDKGHQSMPGADSDTLGHVGVSDTTTVFTIIHRDNLTHPFLFTTDGEGAAWVHVGTESGFEALTVLYYTTIAISFSNTTGITDPMERNGAVHWSWNDGTLRLRFDEAVGAVEVRDVAGRILAARRAPGLSTELQVPGPTAPVILVVDWANGQRAVQRVMRP